MHKNQALLDRLAELIDEFGGGRPSAFALYAGLNPVSITGYMKGRNLPGFEILERICDSCGVSPNWLLKGWSPKYAATNRPAPEEIRIVDLAGAGELDARDFVTVPILNQGAWRDIGSGVLLVSPETTEGYTLASVGLGSRLVALRQPDDSMRPEIEEGDLCIADLEERGADRLSGRLILIEIDGRASVRRCVDGFIVANDSRVYAPRKAGKRKILGVVAEIRRSR